MASLMFKFAIFPLLHGNKICQCGPSLHDVCPAPSSQAFGSNAHWLNSTENAVQVPLSHLSIEEHFALSNCFISQALKSRSASAFEQFSKQRIWSLRGKGSLTLCPSLLPHLHTWFQSPTYCVKDRVFSLPCLHCQAPHHLQTNHSTLKISLTPSIQQQFFRKKKSLFFLYCYYALGLKSLKGKG